MSDPARFRRGSSRFKRAAGGVAGRRRRRVYCRRLRQALANGATTLSPTAWTRRVAGDSPGGSVYPARIGKSTVTVVKPSSSDSIRMLPPWACTIH
jgi:hypothetical protein